MHTAEDCRAELELLQENEKLAEQHEAAQAETIAALRAEVEALKVDAERLDWYENEHTLHGSVECTYVVDGYHLMIMYDGGVVAEFYGASMREAFDAARKESA